MVFATGFVSLVLDPSATIAMDGGNFALSAGPEAVFANPAGVFYGYPSYHLHFSHLLWIQGYNSEFLSVIRNFGKSAWGVGVLFGTPGPITKTMETEYGEYDEQDYGEFWVYDVALVISYARSAFGGKLGFSLAGLYTSLDVYSALGGCLSVGYQKVFMDKLTIGVTLKNLGLTTKLYHESIPLPMLAGIGVSYRLWKLMLSAGAQFAVTDFGASYASAGVKYIHNSWFASVSWKFPFSPSNFLGLRAGVGLTFGRYTLSYTFIPGFDLGSAHSFTLKAEL